VNFVAENSIKLQKLNFQGKKKSMLSPQCVHTWANGMAQATLVVIEWQISSNYCRN
jgi:hypothetical protein